jgi:serine/threonine protein kinase
MMDNLSNNQHYGRYRIIKLLGKGSMSIVYQAIDPILSREVAIKVINPSLCRQPGFIKRFEREAMALAQLHHPHIIDIYDMGQEQDDFYMVIRLLSGGTLKERLISFKQSNQFMPLQQIDYIQHAICDALDHIHQAGFIHRDLKPANVMFGDQDKPFLADFGIVKALESERLTMVGGILGTPFYMSPEQFKGDQVDPRCDIYSMGVVLYEMCTCSLPFKSDKLADVIDAHLHRQPLPPDEINPQISPSVAAVILRALAKTPDDRYPDASDLANAFSAALRPSKKDTVPISDFEVVSNRSLPDAFLKSTTSGVRYKLHPDIDNQIGRSKPNRSVEVDLSAEKGSEFVHSLHAIIRYTDTHWELETPKDIENPVFINKRKVGPNEKVVLANGDRLGFSLTIFIIEI